LQFLTPTDERQQKVCENVRKQTVATEEGKM